MEEWKECKLEQVCENIYSGGTPATMVKEYWNGNLPWLSSGETGQRYIYSTEKTITQLGVDNSSTRYAYKNSTVVASAGQGYTRGQASFLTIDTYVNQSVIVLKPNLKLIDPKYLYFNIDNRYAELRQLSDGTSTRGSLSGKIMKDLSITLPPLPTQQKIAAILSSLDDKIEVNNKINANLEEQSQALFKSWFVDFEPFGGEMPEGWKMGKLSEIANYYNGYAFSSKELLNEPKEDCLDVFKQGQIKKGGGFISDGTKSWYPLSKCQKLKNYILKKGDILMAMTDMKGNVAILGNTAIMPVDNKYIVNQRVGLLRAKKDLNVDFPYLYLLTNNHDFLMDLRSRANSGVQVNLSSTAIKESEVNIAPKEVYKQFNNIVLPLFENILANQQENQKLAIIRDTLLPKLMNGEIEV